MKKSPILFLVFNRPDTTFKVFEAIRQRQPSRLYIAADGPRDSRKDEEKKCELVRSIAKKIDWNCDVKTLFRENNLGCKYAVSSAISWFFENEEEGIILEDDCLPNESFFNFCEMMLDYYRHDKRIMHIGGYNGNEFNSLNAYNETYFFSKYAPIWGWATWRRSWIDYDVNLKNFERYFESKSIYNTFRDNFNAKLFYKLFNDVRLGRVNTWDYQWQFAIWSNHGLAIVPYNNFIKNIGFGEDATHTTRDGSKHSDVILEKLEKVIIHPPLVNANFYADYLKDSQFRGSVFRRLKFYVKNFFIWKIK